MVKNIPDIALHRLQLSRLIVSNALVLGRRGISPNVDKFLKDHGDEPVLEMIISRTVVSSILTGSMKLISTQFQFGLVGHLAIVSPVSLRTF